MIDMNVYCVLTENETYHDELHSIWFTEEKAEKKAERLNNKKDKPPNRFYSVMAFVVRE